MNDRIGRERHADAMAAIDAMGRSPSAGAARRLVRVFDGGAMPTAAPSVFLTHPVSLGGLEIEGATYTQAEDDETVPVVVLGEAPAAGDLLIATAVGGRWVAELGGTTTPTYECIPSPIPLKNLTLSWTNSLLGNGSTTLVCTNPPLPGTPAWTSGCANQMLWSFGCDGGLFLFVNTYFISGGCPGGQWQQCIWPGSAPFTFDLVDSTDSPFHVHFAVTSSNCPIDSADAYTDIYIDE